MNKPLALLVAFTFFMENLDATIIATALPAMATQFGIHAIDLNIGMSAYLLAVAIFIPLGGWLADRFGAKTIFVSAIAVFTLASVLCAVSENLTVFVIARILQGMGGAMMVPVGRLVVVRHTPKKELVQAMAYVTWPGLIAPVLGPPLGGFLVTHFSWQWIFLINVPLGILGVLAALRLVNNEKQADIGKFDFIGFILLASACGSFMYAMDIQNLILSLVGLGLLWLAVYYMRRQKNPLLKFDAFKEQTFSVSVLGGSVFRMTMSAIPFLLPLMFQLAFGLSAWNAGLLILAVFVGNVAMKPFTTPLMRRFGFKQVLLVNGVLGTFSIASCALFSPQLPWWSMIVLMFVSGLTRSLQFTCYTSMGFADIKPQDRRYASTMTSLFFPISFGLGVAVSACLLKIVGQVQQHNVATLQDFQITFLIIAGISLFALIDAIRLKPNAGQASLQR